MEDFIRGIIELCIYLGFDKVMGILALICLIRIGCNISDIKVDIHKLVNQKNAKKWLSLFGYSTLLKWQ